MTIEQKLKEHFAGSRFLFIIGQYSRLGGAERQAIVLADQLRHEFACEVEFLAWGGEGRIIDELKAKGIKTRVFPLSWDRSPLRRFLKLIQLKKFIKREIRPDFLLPYIGFNCKIIGLIWRGTGAKYTWWNQRDEGRGVYGSRLDKYVISSVPDVVSNSLEGKRFLVETFKLDPSEVHVLNNGIEPPQSRNRVDWRAKLGLNIDDVLIIMVANLTKYKDHETLLKAFAKLVTNQTGRGVHLMLVGTHRETTDTLKILAFDLGLYGKVHFVGEVKEVSDCYAASDVAVHSSFLEGCPNAVLEAMAHSLPVCGTDISGIVQALGDDQPLGLLSPPRDVDALEAAISKLVNDAELRKSLGRANRERIKELFDPKTLAITVLSMIQKHQSTQGSAHPR